MSRARGNSLKCGQKLDIFLTCNVLINPLAAQTRAAEPSDQILCLLADKCPTSPPPQPWSLLTELRELGKQTKGHVLYAKKRIITS
jgi:hypothetical protein